MGGHRGATRIGSGGASFNAASERIIIEAVRRARLRANNDSSFVPPPDDFSFIQAIRTFAARGTSNSAGSGRTLTIDATKHLTGGSYDGTADVTIGTDATPAPTALKIVARDADGFTAVVRLILGDAGFIADTGAGSLDLWVANASAHIRMLDHTFSHVNFDLDENGNLILRAGLGLFGKAAIAQVAAPTVAGASYGATEQALLNDIRNRLINLGVYA